jgi:laminin beta 1
VYLRFILLIRCKEGYYGDPANNIPCRECMCPGGQGANQFSKSCYFDARQELVVCACDEGYEGASCDRCSVNYYGNPTEIDGSCQKCQCNGNINDNDRTSCDEVTGKCSNCLYNTAGDYCNVCAPGYYGDAATQDCKRKFLTFLYSQKALFSYFCSMLL